MALDDKLMSISQAKLCGNSKKWIATNYGEMKSIKDNGAWDLIKFPKGAKLVGYK